MLALSTAGQNNVQTVDGLIDQLEQPRISNIDSTLKHALLNLEQAQSNNDIPLQVKLEFTIGYAYYNRNSYDSALKHLNSSHNLALKNNLQDWVAINLNRIGNVYQLKSKYNLALEAYSKAAKINRERNDKQQLARVLVNMGSVYTLTCNNTKSIELMLEALKTFEAISNKNGIAWTSLSISRLFNRIDVNDRALHYAEQALNEYKSLNDQIGVTLSMTELANIYYRNCQYPKALSIAKQVLKINNHDGNKHGKAANHLLIGIIYFKMDSLLPALQNLDIAQNLKQTLNDSVDLSRLNLYLGNVYEAMGNHSKAIHFLNASTQIAQNQGLANELGDIYLSLSSIYQKLGNDKLALDYYQNYSAIKDSINANDISHLEMQYNFEKREQELEFLNQQKEAAQKANIKRQRTFIFIILSVLIISIAFTLVIFHFLKEKQKNNNLLLERNAEIEQQKQEIQTQCEFANSQRDQIAKQQQQITDSITYASRIQKAILPCPETIKQLLNDYFIFYLPKNIVSGDFYWISPIADGRIAVVAADCTGHGIPGALMSMLGATLLKELSSIKDVTAGNILSHLRSLVIDVLHQSGRVGDSQDGMDMALLLFDKDKQQLQFAGAYMPLLIGRSTSLPEVSCPSSKFRNDDFCIYEIKGDKMPIGFHVVGDQPFTTQTINYLHSDTFYIFSDGYTDQFGGANHSKYMLINLKKFLLNIQTLPLADQGEMIISNYEEYKGKERQMDDVIFWGIKV